MDIVTDRYSLLFGDCLERMKEIPDQSVDMILTDPPYGTTACKWDSVIPFKPMWEEVWRVLKPNGVCALFGGNPFQASLIMSAPKEFRYEWIWEKNRAGFRAIFIAMEVNMDFGVHLANQTNLKRSSMDYYPTPWECTQALLDFLNLQSGTLVWEPCAGQGFMSNIIEANGLRVVTGDLVKSDRIDLDHQENFLHSTSKRSDWLITNPPFSEAEQFLWKSKDLKITNIAMIFKSQFWHSKKRIKVFKTYPPHFILPMTWRPDFANGLKGSSPTMEAIWTVWLEGAPTCTEYTPLEKPAKENYTTLALLREIQYQTELRHNNLKTRTRTS